MLRELKSELEKRGISPEVRDAIRNAKICIVDDEIKHLRSLTDGLRKEGFTNVVEKPQVESLNELLDGKYDLLVLDITGIARDVCDSDGVGIVAAVKSNNPALPILVVSGYSHAPDLAKTLSRADLIRKKPAKSVDLAEDVAQLLRESKDKFWGALAVLEEMNRIHADIANQLGFWDRFKLWCYRRSIEKKIRQSDASVVARLGRAADILTKLGAVSLRAVSIYKALR